MCAPHILEMEWVTIMKLGTVIKLGMLYANPLKKVVKMYAS